MEIPVDFIFPSSETPLFAYTTDNKNFQMDDTIFESSVSFLL